MAGVATMGPVVAGGWVVDRPDNRGFKLAVVTSLIFHGALLATWQGLHKPVERPTIAPGPIVARLAAPPKPAPAPEPAAQAPEPPRPRVEEPPPPPAPATPAPRPISKPAPVHKPAPAKAPVAAAKPAAEPAPVAPSAPAVPSAPAPAAKADPQPAPAAPAPAPTPDADAGTLRAYRLAIITTARKYKTYPRVAMDNNWEGKAEVRMVIGANGMIASMSIKTSTGHEILDKAAISMITKAKPLTPIPAALRGKEFTVDVPVIFSLKEDAPGS